MMSGYAMLPRLKNMKSLIFWWGGPPCPPSKSIIPSTLINLAKSKNS